ncbi:hypothetical protein Pint_22832 [Pistacia integerrima]|uniref:Uncharacterized protein n=1 Tax=Pistacia integerrima TaxID=434235 RepID=A0ACC0YJH0_9ROSI|nr:hypothetical protein Pint_22832 [Pistacia integerrima]
MPHLSLRQLSIKYGPVMFLKLGRSIVFRMAFGKRFRGSNFDNHRFQELVQEVEAVMGSFSADECFPYVSWIVDRLSGYNAKLERVFKEFDAFFHQIIRDHLKPDVKKQEQEDIIDVMLKIEREQTESCREARLTNDHINIKAVLSASTHSPC